MESMIGVGVISDKNQDETIRIYVTRSSGQPSFTAEEQVLIESLATFAKQALEFDTLRKAETNLRIRAEDAEKAKSEFMSMINHDLKNPLAAMQVALDMAKFTDHYPVEDLFVDLQSSLTVQRTLIDSLLDMARIGKTEQDYEFENEYPIDLMNEVVNRQRKSSLANNRTIKSNIGENLPAVRCDPIQMGRVFDNLISNALKYSESDVTVSVTKATNRSLISFVIADGGQGIPNSEIDRIFEPFERITDSNKPIEGLGLGLAICKTIVEAHDGTITYQRTEGRNGKSVFEVKLPITE
jgi:signal transduction histidine kinase